MILKYTYERNKSLEDYINVIKFFIYGINLFSVYFEDSGVISLGLNYPEYDRIKI